MAITSSMHGMIFFMLESNSLEDARNKLFTLISNYQGYKKKNIIIVFDAHLVKGSVEKKKILIISQLCLRKRMKLPITILKNSYTNWVVPTSLPL
jgi:hypothetical protein